MVTGVGTYAETPLYSLALVRQFAEKSQADVVRASGMYQADVSKLEALDRLDKTQVSTLRKYAAAIGAEVQIVVVLDGRRYILTG